MAFHLVVWSITKITNILNAFYSGCIKLCINIYQIWWELHFTFIRPLLLLLILNISILIRFSPNTVFCNRWEGPHPVKTTLVINTDIYICIEYSIKTGSFRRSEPVVRGCFSKYVLIKTLQYSQEKTCVGVTF